MAYPGLPRWPVAGCQDVMLCYLLCTVQHAMMGLTQASFQAMQRCNRVSCSKLLRTTNDSI